MKYLSYVLKILLIIILSLFLLLFILLGFEKKKELTYFFFGEYPAQGKYWISIKANDYGHSATVYYKQYIYENEIIDTSNLVIYTDLINFIDYTIDEKIIYDNEKIKEYLLYNGLASIIDENKATEKEKENQNNAIERGVGNWRSNDSNSITSSGQDKSGINILDIINWLIFFVKSRIYFLLSILIGILGVGTIAGGLNIFWRRNNIDVIFSGEISSGKTTILKRLESPEISKAELLKITNTKGKEIKKGKRIAVGKKDIYPYFIDNSGQEYAKIFDSINKKFFRNPHRILIITIALDPRNHINRQVDILNKRYLNSEMSKAVQMLSIVSESRTIKPLDRIIVFINKCDLVYEREEDMFHDNYSVAENLLKNTFDFELLNDLMGKNNKIKIIYGSALKGWGLYSIKENMQEI